MLQEQEPVLSLPAAIALCSLSGLMLALCFPPAGLWFLVWVALAPWMIVLRTTTCGRALVASWLGGMVFFGVLLSWLNLFGFLPWLIACAVESLPLMLWGLSQRYTGRLTPALRMLGAAALWCALEWVRGLGAFGFTWGWLGYSQAPARWLLPMARLVGTVGVSFVIVLANAALAELVAPWFAGDPRGRPLRRSLLGLAATGVLLLVLRAWGAAAPRPDGPTVTAAVVQGSAHGPLLAEDVNTPLTQEEQEAAMDCYAALTAEAARERPALIVWPESAIPEAPEEAQWVAARLARVADEADAWLLAGGAYVDGEGRTFNSAYLYSPSGHLTARYDKVHLVPFGEYVPGRSWLPLLHRYPIRESDFAAGSVPRMLQAGTMTIGAMICFESIFPAISWGRAERGAQVMVVMTNDAWFGRTAAAEQHRQIAVLRAVETGRWVLRGASTGISAIIAPDGRIVAEAGLYEPKALSAEIRLTQPEQPGQRFGTAFAWLMVALSMLLVIAGGSLPRASVTDGAAPPPARPPRRGAAVPPRSGRTRSSPPGTPDTR